MSKFHTYETKITDQSCLVAALKDLGYNAQVHETPAHLYGYQNDIRNETAEVIIPRSQVGQASNDIGFKKNEVGQFGAIISAWDSSRHGESWLKSLNQNYAVAKHTKTAKMSGYKNFTKTVVNTPNGPEIVLKCEV